MMMIKSNNAIVVFIVKTTEKTFLINQMSARNCTRLYALCTQWEDVQVEGMALRLYLFFETETADPNLNSGERFHST